MTLPPFLTKLLHKARHTSGGRRAHPSRDWLVLFAVFLVLLIASIGWNVWFFTSALEGKEAATPAGEGGTADTSAVERANAAFEVRAAEEARYKGEYRFVDPSR